MIQLSNGGIYLVHGKNLIPENEVKKVESILGVRLIRKKPTKELLPIAFWKSTIKAVI